LNPDGSTKECALHAGVIRSRAKLAYEQAARVMDPAEDSSPEEADEPLQDGVADGLALLARFAAKMTEQRLASGALDFELPSPEIVLDADGRAVDIVRASRTVAHRAVEESMLAANRAVARALLGAGEPAIYRVHEAPGPADLESLIELYESFGLLGGDTDGGLSPRSIGRALGRAAGRPEEPLVNLVTLRAMQQARYDEQNLGHYALAFEAYLHFTSPIRRYADLVVHRAVRRLIDRSSAAGPSTAGERRPMQHIAIRTSARERVAMAAERDVLDLTKCSFMAQHVGRELGGTITGVAEHGLYVTLDDFFVEGLIPIRVLPGYFDLDARAHALVARRSGQRFALGDCLRVRVERVDQLTARIDFGIVEGSREPPRDGSNAKRADRPGRRARRSGAPTRRRVRR
jgi:ribonuclease R